MKPILLYLLIAPILSCNNDNEKINAATGTDRSTTTMENKKSPVVPATKGTGLVGTWKMDTEVFDDNGNRIMEEEERKKAYGNRYLLQLNADGTCRIQNMFPGRYETRKDGSHEMLYVYLKKVEGEETEDPLPDIFGIISLAPQEMILQVMMAGEPSSFWIFKRV